MSDAWWMALGLMLVLEGLMPLLNPRGWRELFQRALQLRDGQLRFFGLASVLLGLLTVWLVH